MKELGQKLDDLESKLRIAQDLKYRVDRARDLAILNTKRNTKTPTTLQQDIHDVKVQNQPDVDEMAVLDEIYPEYTGDTIEIDGKERTVFNSNGDRIAKSKEALTNFWRWFGDSKVVDEQGRPLVVYHGSKLNDIKILDSRLGISETYGNSSGGTYSSSNYSVAMTYMKKDGKSQILKDIPEDNVVLLEYGYKFYEINNKTGELTGNAYLKKTRYSREYEKLDETEMPDLEWQKTPSEIIILNKNLQIIAGISNWEFKKFNTNNYLDIAKQIFSDLDSKETGKVYPIYLKIEKPLIVDFDGEQFNGDEYDGFDNIVRNIKKKRLKGFEYNFEYELPVQVLESYAYDNGYDGLIVKNIYDNADARSLPGIEKIGDDYIVFNNPKFAPTEQEKQTFLSDLENKQTIRLGKLPSVYTNLNWKSADVKTNKAVIVKDTELKHDVSMEVVKQLPELYSDPLLVLESATNPDRLVAVIDAKDNSGRQIVVALSPDNKKRNGYHFIPSFYGKDNLNNFIEDAVKSGRLKYIKNNQVSDSLQLRTQALGYTNNIKHKDDIVNPQIKSVDNRGTFSGDTGNIYYQSEQKKPSGKGNRGAYVPALRLIIKANSMTAGTLSHEFAHDWFEQNYLLWRSGNGTKEFNSYWQSMMNAMGIDETASKKDIEKASETFARAFESWLLNKTDFAKSVDVDDNVFKEYQKHLQEIYTDINNPYFASAWGEIGVLKPEIKAWFDRVTEIPAEQNTFVGQVDKAISDFCFILVIKPSACVRNCSESDTWLFFMYFNYSFLSGYLPSIRFCLTT